MESRKNMLLLQDFALARGVNDAIVDLTAKGRAGAISCYAISDLWPASAQQLHGLIAHRRSCANHSILTGVKLALSGAFTPLTAGFTPADDGSLPRLEQLARASERMALHHDILEAELRAQLRRYIAHMDEGPAFIELDPVIPLFGKAIKALKSALDHFPLDQCRILYPYGLSEALPAAPVPLSGLVAQISFASLRKCIWRGQEVMAGGNPARQMRYPADQGELPPVQSIAIDGQFWTACSPAYADERLERFDLDPARRMKQFEWINDHWPIT